MIDLTTPKSAEKENKQAIEYMNSFGVVFNNYFVVYNICQKITIHIDDIKWISVCKKRKITKNFLLIIISTCMFLIAYYLRLPQLYDSLFYSSALILLGSGILVKDFKYKFSIVKYDESIVFEIKKNLKDDAKKIQKIIHEKLKKSKTSL